jgi:RimJ/RimL family protein N-acetyltransferase
MPECRTMTQPPPWLQEPVLSRRLVLRPGRDAAGDRAAAVELLTDSQVRQFIGGPLSAEAAREAASGPLDQQRGSIVLELRHGDDDAEGAVVGVCSLSRERGELEIGYMLLPRYWGKGLGSEAVATVLVWVAEHCADEHVIAVTQTANAASLRLLARLGFVERERFVEYDADQVLLTSPVVSTALSLAACPSPAQAQGGDPATAIRAEQGGP